MAGSFTLLQSQTDPPYSPTLTDDQGNKFVYAGYAPSNFAIKFERVTDGTLKVGAGTFSVDTVNNLLAYQWATVDTNTPGTWNIFLNVTMLSGFERRYEDTMIINAAP